MSIETSERTLDLGSLCETLLGRPLGSKSTAGNPSPRYSFSLDHPPVNRRLGYVPLLSETKVSNIRSRQRLFNMCFNPVAEVHVCLQTNHPRLIVPSHTRITSPSDTATATVRGLVMIKISFVRVRRTRQTCLYSFRPCGFPAKKICPVSSVHKQF